MIFRGLISGFNDWVGFTTHLPIGKARLVAFTLERALRKRIALDRAPAAGDARNQPHNHM